MRPLPRIGPAVTARHQQGAGASAGTLVSNDRQIECRRSWTRVMWHDPRLDAGLAETMWTAPDTLLAGARMLKDGDRCTVVQISAPASPSQQPSQSSGPAEAPAGKRSNPKSAATSNPPAAAPMVLKRYVVKGKLHTAMHMPLRSRARWSWLNGRQLIQAGVLTPAPLACVEDRRAGALRLGCYLLTNFVPGRSLREVIQHEQVSPERLRNLAMQFVAIWRALGALRIGHGDMKDSNFILDADDRMWLIDLDGMRMYRSSVLLRRERRNDLMRFFMNWQDRPEVAAVFRARIGTG